MRNSFILIVLINFFLITFLYSQDSDKIAESTDLIGQNVPDFEGITISGDTIENNDYLGKVIFMQFMYFSCRPCLLEVSYLNKLSQKYSKNDLEIIAVIPNTPRDIVLYQTGTDTVSIFSRIRGLFDYDSIQYTILPECMENIAVKPNQIGVDCDEISKVFIRDFYPTSYLIDKSGIIRKVFVGFDTYEKESEIKKIESAIVELL